MPSTMTRRWRAVILTLLALAMPTSSALPAAAAQETLTLMTHDSFFLPDEVIDAFEQEHGVDLEILHAGDAGAMVNQAILTAGHPLADVLYGVDNTFLSRALAAGIFEAYRSPELVHVPADLVLDPEHRVTPIDYGDVCLNIDRDAFAEGGLPVPTELDDLLDPVLAGKVVVEDPATSSPGLAFLLATIAILGEDPETGWRPFWQGLRDNGVIVESGWEEAYYGSFSGGSGGGEAPIVVSYATSPVAEVVFGPDPEASVSPTAALDVACFRQVELAAVLAGTDQPELAAALIDHLLAPATQAALPLAMYVYPARSDVKVPEVFERFALVPSAPLRIEPEIIEARREDWIREWTDIVLR